MRSRPQPVIGRRAVLRGAALGVGAGGLLSACGIPAAKQSAGSCLSTDLSATEKSLIFSNWPSYMDESEEKVNGKTVLPTLAAFQQQTGIKVTYTADVNDNAEFYAKVRDQLGACQPCGRDIFVLTDWMAARTVGLGWIQQLDHANIPNVDKHLLKQLKAPRWDPNRDHSVPWQTGLTGIAYNAKFTKEVGSFADLLSRGRSQGQGHDAVGDARHDVVHAPAGRRRPEQVRRRRLEQGAGKTHPVRRLRADPPLHRQRLRAGPQRRQHRRLPGLVGRRARAAGGQPGHQVRGPRRGSRALVGQPAGAEQGRPQGECRGVDELLLRPRGRGRRWRPG